MVTLSPCRPFCLRKPAKALQSRGWRVSRLIAGDGGSTIWWWDDQLPVALVLCGRLRLCCRKIPGNKPSLQARLMQTPGKRSPPVADQALAMRIESQADEPAGIRTRMALRKIESIMGLYNTEVHHLPWLLPGL